MAVLWRDSLAGGVEEIDRQHQELFRQVSELLESCREGRGRQTVCDTVAFLKDYVITHFTDEEKHMRAAGYPKLADHLAEHQAFRRDLEELAAKIEGDEAGLNLVLAVNRQVVDWLVNHVSKSDKAFGNFMKATA